MKSVDITIRTLSGTFWGLFLFPTGLSITDHTQASREEHIHKFMEWFKQHGGEAEHVTVARFGAEGLGLKALTDIKVSFCKKFLHVLCCVILFIFVAISQFHNHAQ